MIGWLILVFFIGTVFGFCLAAILGASKDWQGDRLDD